MADIYDKVQQIRQAIYGKDVRESIASGIETINEQVEVLDATFEQLIINAGNSNAEIVAARVDAEGTAYPTLGDRLNAADAAFEQQKTEITDARGGFNALRSKIDSYAINVKDFGAKGDGITDDTGALQSAIDYAVTNKLQLYVPPGVYLVSAPLRPNKALDPLQPVEGFAIFGANCVVPYNTYKMLSIIKAADTFPVGESILDFRYTIQTTIANLGIYGIPTVNGIELGERTSQGRLFSHHRIEYCSIHNCDIGIKAANASLLKIRGNNVSGCRYIGIGLLEAAGDSDLEGNFINTNNVDFQGNDLYQGAGIVIAYGSGNTNIRGGKIEWNAKGVIIYGSVGVNISGVNFDVNKWFHIYVEPIDTGISAKSARSICISGNRFLSGGTFRNSNMALGGSHIQIAAGPNKAAYVTIVGNTFRKAGYFAYDLDPSTPVGPITYAIRAEGDGDITVVLVGNDLLNSTAASSALTASGPNVRVYAIGNACNLPFETYGGALIFSDSYDGRFREIYGSGPPTTGTWKVGDRVINTNPTAGGYIGWVCVQAGTPGVWKGFGTIAS